MTINQRMFATIAASGHTEADLARALAVGAGQMSTWKTRGTDPPAKYIVKICEFLSVSVEFLLTGEERTPVSAVHIGENCGVSLISSPNSGTQIIRNGGERVLTDEEVEVLRLFSLLDVKRRMKLLNLGYSLEDEVKGEDKQ